MKCRKVENVSGVAVNTSNGNSKEAKLKKRLAGCGKSFEEMLNNAQSTLSANDVETPCFDALGSVLEDLTSLGSESLDNRLSNIEKMYQSKELEALLGVDTDYYRDRYFALLKVVAIALDNK